MPDLMLTIFFLNEEENYIYSNIQYTYTVIYSLSQTSLGLTVFVIDRCSVYIGFIKKDFLH